MLYQEDVNSCSQSKLADKVSEELGELMIICQKNLHYIQELQKQPHDKRVRIRSPIRPLLPSVLEKVSKRRKYLGAGLRGLAF